MHSLPPSLLWSRPACPDLPTSHGLKPLFCRPALLLLLENMESDLCPKATKTQKPPEEAALQSARWTQRLRVPQKSGHRWPLLTPKNRLVDAYEGPASKTAWSLHPGRAQGLLSRRFITESGLTRLSAPGGDSESTRPS